MKQRLHKFLAAAGIASRRKAEELIQQGCVTVNGKLITTLPAFVDPEKDTVRVNSRKVNLPKKQYLLLNKPKNVVCTNSDPQGRKKAIDLVRSSQRLVTAGRLDADTTGLIIITNDTDFVNKLTHPKYKLPKTYVAKVKGSVKPHQIERLKRGIYFAEGKTGKSAVKIIKRTPTESIVQLIITQGLNRQVRRMLAKVDLPVKSLKRTHIGNITDRGLSVGKFRHLTAAEINHLRKLTSGR